MANTIIEVCPCEPVGPVPLYALHICCSQHMGFFMLNFLQMRTVRNEAGTLLPMTVMDNLTVNVLPNTEHKYLMTTKEVAKGYGVSTYAIQQAQHRHGDELLKGKHYVVALTICQSDLPQQLRCAHNAILWTKRGIVRLGFFIKSERAKLFRDWAEDLIICVDQQRSLFGSSPARQFPRRTKANRLTQERLISILSDVCRIDDKELRVSITNKLTQHDTV